MRKSYRTDPFIIFARMTETKLSFQLYPTRDRVQKHHLMISIAYEYMCAYFYIYFTQSGWKNDTTALGDCTKPCKMFTKLTIRACLYTIYNNRLSDLCRSISNNRESIYTVEKKFTIHSSHTYIYTYCSHTYQNRYRYIGTYNFSSTQLNWNRYRYIVST